MSNFLTVFNFEFKQYLKKKSTIVMFVIYFVLAFGVTFIPSLVNGNSFLKNMFAGEDNSSFQRSAYIIKNDNFEIDKVYLKEAKEYQDRATVEQDIKDEKIDEAIIFTNDSYEYITKSTNLYSASSDFSETFDVFVKQYTYKERGLNYFEIQEVDSTIPKAKITSVGASGDMADVAIKSGIVYFLSFVVYILVFMFGTVLANNVAREKTNRAMELLVVTVKPATLIVGKVLAFSTIAIMQVGLMLCAFFTGIKMNVKGYSDYLSTVVNNIDYSLIAVWCVFSLTGFVMLMFMFASFASLVSRIEEVSTVLTLPIMIFFVAFFVNIYTMGSAGNGNLVNILSYFPLTSYFSMVTRYALTEVDVYEILISLLVLLATTVLIAWICIKVYRNATLRYGKKLNFFSILRNK